MSDIREKWKPALLALIFCLGFFEFSLGPFKILQYVEGDPNVPMAEVANSLQPRNRRSEDEQIDGLKQDNNEIRVKRHSSKLTGDYNYNPLDLPSQRYKRRSRKQYRLLDSSENDFQNPNRRHTHHTELDTYPDTDYQDYYDELVRYPKKSSHKRSKNHKKHDPKRKILAKSPNPAKALTKEQNQTLTRLTALANPRAPLDLPIVKPEMLKDDYQKFISTIDKPFHFHIPILSKTPQRHLKMTELLMIAKKYKTPLTYDPKVIRAAVIGQSLTLKQRESMRRIVRDSPVLDFLNLAVVLQKRDIGREFEQDIKSSSSDNRTKRSDSEEDSAEYKVAEVHLTATDEILQQLLGDKDDLLEFQKKRDQTKREMSTGRSLKVPEPQKREENVNDATEDIVSSELFKPHKNNEKRQSQDSNAGEGFTDQPHHRAKRGLGSWLKKKFGKKTTTEAPEPERKPSQQDYSERDNAKSNSRRKEIKEETNYFVLKTDPNGDTEVDKLLPKYLRRSSYIKRQKAEQDGVIGYEGSKSDESFEKKEKKGRRNKSGSGSGSNEEGSSSSENYKKKHTRTKRDLHADNDPNSERFADEMPELSKEELKLVQEMISNIAKQRCFTVDSDRLESLQVLLSVIIDSSSLPEFASNNHQSVDRFLNEILDCGSNAENTFKWKTDSDLSHNRLTDFEELLAGSGGPLQRTKRILRDSFSSETSSKESSGDINNVNTDVTVTNVLNMISSIFKIFENSCDNIGTLVVQSIEKTMRQTMQENFKSFQNDPKKLDEFQSFSKLDQSLQTCLKDLMPKVHEAPQTQDSHSNSLPLLLPKAEDSSISSKLKSSIEKNDFHPSQTIGNSDNPKLQDLGNSYQETKSQEKSDSREDFRHLPNPIPLVPPPTISTFQKTVISLDNNNIPNPKSEPILHWQTTTFVYFRHSIKST